MRYGITRAVAALTAILLVAALPLAAALEPHANAPETGYRGHGLDSLAITVGDNFAFTPDTLEAAAPGDNVTITVTELGTTNHTFTLSSVANYSFPTSDGATELQTYFAAHPPLVNLTISGTTGFKASATFKAPALGVYEYVCLEPSHFSSGMFGFFGSGVAPSGPAGPGQPVGVYIIAGVIVTLVVLALVLGFVVGKREGSTQVMPPERLGYPEPEAPQPPTARPPH
ncbi:MAG TPA: cupredoxin domain-containing protein [Thermoplasmata archaeon]|nr:cupredoxin domain-containing protein [Thermoplasmata archaeon]